MIARVQTGGDHGSWRWWLPVAALAATHVTLLLVNLGRVPLTYGYDWPGHLTYLFHLAETGTTPPPEVSPQFFNPPLYYLAVIGFHRLTGAPLLEAGPLFNLVCAAAALILLIALSRRLWPDHWLPAAWLLGPYVVASTTYRVYAMTRPEPLLMPLFAGTLFLVARGPRDRVGPVLLTGLLAGLAAGTRQWGWFLEAALLVWLALEWRVGSHRSRGGRPVTLLLAQLAAFAVPAAALYAFRGASLAAFNAPVNPSGLAFLVSPELEALFSTPVRPNLDDRFWPILYADMWGDYWRYWREALARDPLTSSAATVLSLRRIVWAALPATLLMGLGFIVPVMAVDRRPGWSRFARILTIVSLGGFLAFSWLFAGSDKGDTVKSAYVAFLLPLGGWFAGRGTLWLARRHRHLAAAGAGALALLMSFGLPLAVYTAPAQMAGRTWTAPTPASTASTTFGEAYTLVGLDAASIEDEGRVTVTLYWRSDGYRGRSFKVFVHAVDGDGVLLAQADGVPAGWARPTNAWMLGEYIVDRHELGLDPEALDRVTALWVGMYDAATGDRLTTTAGLDRLALPWPVVP